jgi:hypothetical protein
LGIALGPIFTEPVKNAWLKLWTTIVSVLFPDVPPPKANSPPPPATTTTQETKEADAKAAHDKPTTPKTPVKKAAPLLTKAEIKSIQESWKKVEHIGEEPVGLLLFKHIFTIAPAAVQLFSFKNEPKIY